MAIPVTEFKALYAAGAGRHGLIERVGAAAGKGGFALPLPHAVQRLESRR
jgi:hypothetical protein